MRARFRLTVQFDAEILDGHKTAEYIKKYHDTPSMMDKTLKQLLLDALRSDKELFNVYLNGTHSKVELLETPTYVSERKPFHFRQSSE